MFEGFSLSFGPDDGEEFPRLTDAEFAESQSAPLPPEFAHLKPFGADPNELVQLAAATGPSPQTLGLLTVVPFSKLSDEARSLALQQLDRLTDTVEAHKATVIAEIAGPPPATQRAKFDDFAAHEIGVATRCSVYAADTKIAIAREMASRFRATRDAMMTGGITASQTRVMIEEFGHLDEELREELEANMLKYSHRQNHTNFRRSIRRWLAKKDPTWTRRAERARREVVVEHYANDNGTGEISIRGPLEDTHLIDLALAARAAQLKPDVGGTLSERKFVALREWADAALTGPGAPTQHGLPVRVDIVAQQSTVAGLDDLPVEIPGVGMLPASAMRWALADGAEVRGLLVNATTGFLKNIDPTRYQVPPQLADGLIARYVTAAAPHSSVPASGADMEHNTPHPLGPTDEHNLTPVCRRWHRAKTHGGWTYEKDPDTGIVTWRSPTGLTVEIDPYDYRAGP